MSANYSLTNFPDFIELFKTRSRTKVSFFFHSWPFLANVEVNSPKPLKSWRWFDISLTSLAPSWSHLWSSLFVIIVRGKKRVGMGSTFSLCFTQYSSPINKKVEKIYIFKLKFYTFVKKKVNDDYARIHAIRIFHYGCKFCRPQF